MTRVSNTVATHRRRKKIIKAAKGYVGIKNRAFKSAKEQFMRSGVYAFFGRKQRKRDFRRLWITRINASLKPHGVSYSRFMCLLKLKQIYLNRKQISEMAIFEPNYFLSLISQVCIEK